MSPAQNSTTKKLKACHRDIVNIQVRSKNNVVIQLNTAYIYILRQHKIQIQSRRIFPIKLQTIQVPIKITDSISGNQLTPEGKEMDKPTKDTEEIIYFIPNRKKYK